MGLSVVKMTALFEGGRALRQLHRAEEFHGVNSVGKILQTGLLHSAKGGKPLAGNALYGRIRFQGLKQP